MSKPVNILEVLQKAYNGKKISDKDTKAIIDAYGRALTMKKILEDFIKVNRNLVIEIAETNLVVGKDYTLNITEKQSVKIDNALVKEKLGELEYHNCKVPTSYKQIQSMPLSDKVIKKSRDDMSIGSIVDFKLAKAV